MMDFVISCQLWFGGLHKVFNLLLLFFIRILPGCILSAVQVLKWLKCRNPLQSNCGVWLMVLKTYHCVHLITVTAFYVHFTHFC